jgi:hypothetical protein
LRADARVALTLLGAGDVAFTANGRAAVIVESIDAAKNDARVRATLHALSLTG